MPLNQEQKDEIIRCNGHVKSLTNIIQRRTRWANNMPICERTLEKIRISDFRILRDEYKARIKEIKNE